MALVGRLFDFQLPRNARNCKISQNILQSKKEHAIFLSKERGGMTGSASIQAAVMALLADGTSHTVQEIKHHLRQVGISEYSKGQFSGSINTLLRN